MSKINYNVDVSFIFQITDRVLWNVFKKNEIGDVLLPFIVIRRLDCILESVNEKVRSTFNKHKGEETAEQLDGLLKKAAGGLQFYNTSQHTLESIKDDPRDLEINFYNYLSGFNIEVREIIDNFQFDKVVARLVKNKLLYQMIDAICEVNLHTSHVDNHNMGYIFEELIRLSNEQSNETAGEHFTPRDVIDLMIRIVFSTEKKTLLDSKSHSIYDPTLGTGGMINLAKSYILNNFLKTTKNKPDIITYGQEINEQSYAIAKSEALITGENADNIRHGNTFTEDRFPNKTFHYIFANPPYGVTWSKDAEFIRNESADPFGRFYSGLPSISDGQLLFIQHMISKLDRVKGKMAVVTNGSPLYTGSAGSGESNIRKWIISNDLLECIVGLPKDLFYNTGINTYIWFFNTNKEEKRKGKVQLINANIIEDMDSGVEGFCRPEKKTLGNKRNKIESIHIEKLLKLYTSFKEDAHSKILNNEDFGFYQVIVNQPLCDKKGNILYDKKGNKLIDIKRRDKEIIPLNVDIEEYFEKQVLKNVPNAFIDYSKTRIGYEINFGKYFYKYQPVRDSNEILSDIKKLEFGSETEKGITDLLDELFKL